jgi:hypothetical protein
MGADPELVHAVNRSDTAAMSVTLIIFVILFPFLFDDAKSISKNRFLNDKFH